ncbi:MAG: UDP-N-acetylmuramate dehydrogenase [Clostridia bacterium]|nr:UDP-N-acetylmuramate dehydrogenase [Clostridia bacterium]
MYKRLCAVAGEDNVTRRAKLDRLTTFRIGGEADHLVNVSSAEALGGILRLCRDEQVPVYVMGRGSNLVFDDAGFRGVVLRLCDSDECFRIVEEDNDSALVYAFAGAALTRLAIFAFEHGLSGLEFASGIPGSVGGGVVMDAGAYGGQLADCVVRSEYVRRVPDYEAGAFDGAAQQFGYRTSVYQSGEYIVTGAYFRLRKGREKADIGAEMRELNGRRREKQPLEYPSAGSAFNRPAGDYAGRLIEASGLRGYRIGGAQVSEKQCGFIVNRGGATAADVRALVNAVREKVYADSGVLLEPEIKFVGERG